MFTALNNNYFPNRKVYKNWGQESWKQPNRQNDPCKKLDLRIQLQEWDYREPSLNFKSL